VVWRQLRNMPLLMSLRILENDKPEGVSQLLPQKDQHELVAERPGHLGIRGQQQVDEHLAQALYLGAGPHMHLLVLASPPRDVVPELEGVDPAVLAQHRGVVNLHHVADVLPQRALRGLLHLGHGAPLEQPEEPDGLDHGRVEHVDEVLVGDPAGLDVRRVEVVHARDGLVQQWGVGMELREAGMRVSVSFARTYDCVRGDCHLRDKDDLGIFVSEGLR